MRKRCFSPHFIRTKKEDLSPFIEVFDAFDKILEKYALSSVCSFHGFVLSILTKL